MKKSIGRKLLAGIVSVSMILGIPVAGYSQEEDLQAVIVSEEAGQMTEEVLAGAVAEAPVPEEATEAEDSEELSLEAVLDEAAEDAEADGEEMMVIAADEEEPEEDLEEGILLEADADEEEILEAADETVIKDVDTADALASAIQQAAEGSTIRLTTDIDMKNALSASSSLFVDAEHMRTDPVTNTITIDLNSYTLTVPTTNSLFVRTGKTLTLAGGTFNGRIIADGGTVNLPSGLNITGTVTNLCIKNNGTANMTGAAIINSATSTHAVEVEEGKLDLKSGSVKVTQNNVTAILLADDADAVVEMSGGNVEVNGNGPAVNVSNGKMTVTGGAIKSSSGGGVEVWGGTFSISKGAIVSKLSAVKIYKKGKLAVSGKKANGSYTTQVESSDSYAVLDYWGGSGDPNNSDYESSIEITGGYFKGKTKEFSSEKKTELVKVTTDAVGFAHDVNRKYLPSVNCRTSDDDSDGIYTIYELTASNAVAAYIRDNETFYTESVQEAMNEISGEYYSPKNDDTVKLFKDAEETAVSVAIPRVIDLNKHTLKTEMTVTGCKVTIKNGTLQSYTDDNALIVGEGADVTADASLTVKSPGKFAVHVGDTASKTYSLTVKGKVESGTYSIYVGDGNCTVLLDGATITANAQQQAGDNYSALRIDGSGAKVTIKNSKLSGPQGMSIYGGEVTISGSSITGTGDQEGNPDPDTTGTGAAILAYGGKITIQSGTFTSQKGHALFMKNAPTSGSEISGGTFISKRSNWDAVAGKPVAKMFTGGTYAPNKKNAMKGGVDTANVALVGVTDGTFYVGKYKEVVPTLYKANSSVTKLTVGAAAKSTLLYGFKEHAAILNLTTEDIDVLVGTDNTVTKNKGTLPKTADKEAWIFHIDLVELKASINKEATCTTPAVSADCWYCDVLKKAYKAADGKEEAADGTITEAAKGHSWGAWNANGDRVCSVCGAKEHDDSKKQPAYQISGNPKKLKVKAAGGRKLTVSWKKPTKSKLKKIKGVQIQVATDSNFTNIVKTKKVKKTKTSYTFKKLKKGQKYYVRVRFYKGSQISKWSPVKNRKVK